METFKNILAFYPLFVVITTFIVRMIDGYDSTLVGALFGIVLYPLFWFIYVIMSVAGENCVVSSKTNERGNDDRQ